jgi:hypothetical protein
MHQKVGNFRLERFWALWVIPRVLPEGQTEEWKAFKLSVKAANVPKWAQGVQESIWELRGTMGCGRKTSDEM